jgi:hypothetical protein
MLLEVNEVGPGNVGTLDVNWNFQGMSVTELKKTA